MRSRHFHSLRNGLAGYWRLDEASGGALSHNGALDLAQTGTVGQATGPGQIPFARTFSAGNYLGLADPAALTPLNAPVTIAVLAYLTDKSVFRALVSKYLAAGNQREYFLAYTTVTDRFRMQVSPDGATIAGSSVDADTLGSPVLNTWYWVFGGYTGTHVWIQVDDLARNLTEYTGGVFDGNAAFNIGAYLNGASGPWSGNIAAAGYWSRTLTRQECLWIHNRWRGRFVI